MIKLIGILSLSLGAALCGFYKSASVSRRIEEEDAAISLLEHIKECISAYGAPLDEIYKDYRDAVLKKSGLLSELSKGNSVDILGCAVRKCEKKLMLPDDIKLLLCDFSEKIGLCRTKEQGKNCCDKYIIRLRGRIGETRKNTLAYSLLYKKAGIIVAALLAIILF